MVSGAEWTSDSVRSMSALPRAGEGEDDAQSARLGGRRARFGAGDQPPLNQSFRERCAIRYGRLFEEWLSQTQKDRLNAGELEPEQADDIEQALKSNTPLKAARGFLDRFISIEGEFADPQLAQDCALNAVNHHRTLEGEPSLSQLPDTMAALLLSPELGRCVRDALLARPWLPVPIPVKPVSPSAGPTEAAPSSAGEEATRRVTRILTHALTTRYGQIIEAEPYFAAIDRLGLPATNALELKCDLLDRADYRDQMLTAASLFPGRTDAGGQTLTAWHIPAAEESEATAVTQVLARIETGLRALADPASNDAQTQAQAHQLLTTLEADRAVLLRAPLEAPAHLWELTRALGQCLTQHPALGRALIAGALDSASS